MPRRTVLTTRQRAALFDLPTTQSEFLTHYILSDADLSEINIRRGPHNQIGFAVQLCALRHPGRLLQRGEIIPAAMLDFIGSQLGLNGDDLLTYGARDVTCYQHSAALQRIYVYRQFTGDAKREIDDWLPTAAETARTNDGLASNLVAEMRRRSIIVPAVTTIERLCADSLVKAERTICQRIASRLDASSRIRLLGLLEETTGHNITRFVWLRQHEAGNTSRVVNDLLDRLDRIIDLELCSSVLREIPAHRIARLRRQGERYYADGLRDLSEDRRLAILAVCAVEWHAAISDAVVESHDRIMGKLYRSAERICAAQIGDQKSAIEMVLKSFADTGTAMVVANDASDSVGQAVENTLGWVQFQSLVETANGLVGNLSVDPLDFVVSGYPRLRRYTPRLLRTLELQGGRAAEPLLAAIQKLRDMNEAGDTGPAVRPPVTFARPKWRKRLTPIRRPDRKKWETAVLFAIRDGFRSGDIWLEDSRRYRKLSADLVPAKAIATCGALYVPLNAGDWLKNRTEMLRQAMQVAGNAAQAGLLPSGTIKDGVLRFGKLERRTAKDTGGFILDLYKQIPPTRITDILFEVETATGFSDAFTDLRTGMSCKDNVGLLTVILADGINLGLKKMSSASGRHTFWELLRIARWHVQEDAYTRALATIIDAQAALPMAKIWGL